MKTVRKKSGKRTDHFSNAISVWKNLPKGQKTSLIALIIITLLVLPVTAFLSLQVARYRSRAQYPATPVTPPGTNTPTPTIDPKIWGNSLLFENQGFNDSYTETNIVPDLVSESFTVETWVKVNRPNSGDYIRVYTPILYPKLGSVYDYGYIYKLTLEVQERGGSARPIFYALMSPFESDRARNTISVGSSSSLSILPETWTHVAVSGYSEGDLCFLDLYINGKKVDSSTKYHAKCSYLTRDPQKASLAKAPEGSGGIGGYYFDGQIDELRISDNVRYTSDFSVPSAPFSQDENTLLLHHFDEEPGSRRTYDNNNNIHFSLWGDHVDFAPRDVSRPTSTPTPTVPVPTPSPTSTPPLPSPPSEIGYRIFITSQTYNANLGGLTGADRICQTHANQANIGGLWKAWLSDSNTSASDRLRHSTYPYLRMDGAVIANDWQDLTDGSIRVPINYDENSVPHKASSFYAKVWTNTGRSGNVASPTSNCKDWTSGSYNDGNAIAGIFTYTDTQWTQDGSEPCSVTNTTRLYCVEQTIAITPTPTPKEPTATPTIAPPPTVTPTPTPTPPSDNDSPTFWTRSLKRGRVGRSYEAKITARDGDRDDMKMFISGLPQGLRAEQLPECSQRTYPFFGKFISCTISGVPTTQGTYQVRAQVYDIFGASDLKIYNLTIR